MIATIHQPQYLPWLGYFDKADRSDIFVLLDNVQFKKNDWQNRNKIRTSQKWQWLTVPVLHDFGQKIRDVRVNNRIDWKRSHLKAIVLNYGKAPYYEEYISVFEEAYSRPWKLLIDINLHFIKKFIELLGIDTKIVLASEYDVSENSTQRLIDLCKKVDVDTYLCGADGQKYMDFSMFQQQGINIQTQKFQHPVYPQLWTGKENKDFLSHMSVLDLLMNCGSKSLEVIRSERARA